MPVLQAYHIHAKYTSNRHIYLFPRGIHGVGLTYCATGLWGLFCRQRQVSRRKSVGLQDDTLMVERKKAYGIEKEETKWNGKL